MQPEESLNALLTEAVEKVDNVISRVFELAADDTNLNIYLGKIGRAAGLLNEVRSMMIEKHPELKPAPAPDCVKDDEITVEERILIKKLRPEDISLIDKTIHSNITELFRKTARVVADVSDELKERYPEITYLFYSERIRLMVKRGIVESQGDLNMMRYSEIKKAQKS